MDRPAAETEAVGRDGSVIWTADVPMLNDRFLLWEFTKVSVLSVAIMAILVAAMGWLLEGEPVLLPWRVLGIGVVAFFGAFALVSLLMGNSYRVTFGISPEGVIYQSGRRERRLNRLAMLAGGLAGNPSAAGAGALAASREALLVPWQEVHTVRIHPGPRVIVIKNSWRTMLRLYCPVDLFPQACAAAERFHREFGPPPAHLAAATRPPVSWPRRVAWIVAGLALTAGAQAWYWNDFEVLARIGIAGGGLVALCAVLPGPARRFAALLAGFSVLAHGAGLTVSALDPVEGLFGTSPAAVLDTPVLVVAGACTAALTFMAGWCVFGPRSRGEARR